MILEISWSSLWRILFFVVLVTILFLGREILLGLFLAIVISSGVDAAVNFLEDYGIPRSLGVIFIFLVILFLFVSAVYIAIPIVISETSAFLVNFGAPGSGTSPWWAPLFGNSNSQSATDFVSKISAKFFSGSISPLSALSDVVGNFSLAIAVVASAFYLSLQRDGIERFIKFVFPIDYEEQILRIYGRSRKRIGQWFRTQFFLSIIIGLPVWTGLTILGVRHAALLGFMASIFEIVPILGPILSGAIAMLVALSQSVALALYTLILFLAINQFEAHILVPLMMRRIVGLHPVIVIISILMGIQIGGILGLVIAVPAAATIEETIQEWSDRRRLRVA